MAYRDPRTVVSPRNLVSELNVIFDGGAKSYSVALMKWENRDAVGVRWNGEDNSVGNPQSRSVPTWFILPYEVAIPYLKIKLNDKKISTLVESAIQKYLNSNNYAALS